jgi:hypothetical protein
MTIPDEAERCQGLKIVFEFKVLGSDSMVAEIGHLSFHTRIERVIGVIQKSETKSEIGSEAYLKKAARYH